jgi:hypothetical protein
MAALYTTRPKVARNKPRTRNVFDTGDCTVPRNHQNSLESFINLNKAVLQLCFSSRKQPETGSPNQSLYPQLRQILAPKLKLHQPFYSFQLHCSQEWFLKPETRVKSWHVSSCLKVTYNSKNNSIQNQCRFHVRYSHGCHVGTDYRKFNVQMWSALSGYNFHTKSDENLSTGWNLLGETYKTDTTVRYFLVNKTSNTSTRAQRTFWAVT